VTNITLDVHSGRTQFSASRADGTILSEAIVATEPEALRRATRAIAGPKRVVFENGPLAAMVIDALQDEVEEIIACDPTRNALIARAEDSNDERDARRLAVLARANALTAVYVPSALYRSLRSLTRLQLSNARRRAQIMTQVKAFCLRQSVTFPGRQVFAKRRRAEVLARFADPASRFQVESLLRLFDAVHIECVAVKAQLRRMTRSIPIVSKLMAVAGIGELTAYNLVAWVVHPSRFKNFKALAAYAGLSIGQNHSNWRPTQRARASKRGQRLLKRVLFLAARAALRGKNNAFARRYRARIDAGWEDRKAIRDVARTMLQVVYRIWITGEAYDDARISVPAPPRVR